MPFQKRESAVIAECVMRHLIRSQWSVDFANVVPTFAQCLLLVGWSGDFPNLANHYSAITGNFGKLKKLN